MRSTKDLINELQMEAVRLTAVAIAVGFEKKTKFVFAHEPDSLGELNALVQSGGEPVGLVGYLNVEGEARFYSRPLQEYADEEWVGGYLNSLTDSFLQVLKSAGYNAQKIAPEQN